MKIERAEIVVVGSGFAGSILARVLARLGREVLLVERGRHPRFALGESSTPLANLALERLAARYELPDLFDLAAHGRWLESLPHLGRGLKRGFTFYRHRPGERWTNGPANDNRLLVAASPNDRIADSHWLRRDVDAHLVAEAVAAGVEYRDETRLDGFEAGRGGARLTGEGPGGRLAIACEAVIDATGPGGFLARALPISSALDQVRLDTRLLYGHFRGVADFAEVVAEEGAELPAGPYPDDRAAVHHLLDEGWMYVLPFDPGVGGAAAGERLASVGFVLRNGSLDETEEPAAAFRSLLGRYPSLERQLAVAEPVRPVALVPRIQHRLASAAGERWLLLPHAYAFYDPLFSTGIAWSLLAVERIARAFEESSPAGEVMARLAPPYGELLAREADQVERLVETAWLAMGIFRLFAAAAHLYFATVSYAESRQRLAPERLPEEGVWEGFLGCDDPLFAALVPEALELLEALRQRPGHGETAAFEAWIAAAIAPRNVAGLADPAKNNLYPADLDLLVERADLLGLTAAEVEAALPRLRGG